MISVIKYTIYIMAPYRSLLCINESLNGDSIYIPVLTLTFYFPVLPVAIFFSFYNYDIGIFVRKYT